MKKIKKLVLMILLGAMVLGVTACSGGNTSKDNELEGSLEEIMEKVYSGSKVEFPGMETIEINNDNAEYFLGVNDIKFDEAIGSEPMMSSQAHSLVLLRLSEGEDVETVKGKIKDNVDGRKWICVGVDEKNIITDNIGNLVILIMDDNSKAIQDSFRSLIE